MFKGSVKAVKSKQAPQHNEAVRETVPGVNVQGAECSIRVRLDDKPS
jgi:hypothetical protein